MFELLMPVPRNVYVAISGGPDSMAAVSFLKNNHSLTLLYFNHGTKHGQFAEEFVKEYAKANSLPLISGHIVGTRGDESEEEFWRNERYNFFESVAKNKIIVIAHNLDDATETWLFTSIHGKPSLIPPRRGQFIRPFLLCRKKEMQNWCDRKNVPYVTDPGNSNLSYPRVRLRTIIIPEILKIAGIHTVIAKKYRALYKESSEDVMLKVDGRPFRCDCQCNVFSKVGDVYQCNACRSEFQCD